MVIERLRSLTDTPFDAHLMISDPARYLDEYIRAGCEAITFHLEAVPEPVSLLREIRRKGVVAGLAINPGTPFSAAEPFLRECDLFLVMSVHPGFGGQKFIPDVVSKIQDARAHGWRRSDYFRRWRHWPIHDRSMCSGWLRRFCRGQFRF